MKCNTLKIGRDNMQALVYNVVTAPTNTRGEHIDLHTFYTGRKKISTKAFGRGVFFSKDCSRFGTESVQHQPRGQPQQGDLPPAQKK